jgi:hypothetical protein
VYSCVAISIFACYFFYVVCVHGLDFATSSSNLWWFIKSASFYAGLGLLAAIVSVGLQALSSRMGK